MSVELLSQKLQQDILNELVTTNQLLQQISHELHQIKQMTNPGGEFEVNITNNVALVRTLADLQQVNIDTLPPLSRIQIDSSKEQSNMNTM